MNKFFALDDFGWFKNKSAILLIYAAVVLFYLTTLSHSHAEVWDGFLYALTAEQATLTDITDTRSVLFHVINRVAYLTSQAVGLDLSAFVILQGLSILAGAGAVVFMARLLILGFSLSAMAAWVGALTLGLSYGFWRYSVEVEVYAGSILFTLIVLNLILDLERSGRSSPLHIVPAAIVAGLAVLYYQPNAIQLFVAIPMLWLRTRFSWFFVYAAVGSLVVLAGLVLAFMAKGGADLTILSLLEFINDRGDEFKPNSFSIKTVLSMALAFGHDVFSSNWMFGAPYTDEVMQSALQGRILTPRVFSAVNFQPYIYIAACLLPLLMIMHAWMIRSGLDFSQQAFERSWLYYILAWLILFTLTIGILDPASVEVWIMVLPPFIILYSVFVIHPYMKKVGSKLPIVLLVMLGTYNYFGGIGLVQDEAGDYFHAKTEWFRTNTSANDSVLFNDSNTRLMNYLRYSVKTGVISSMEKSTANTVEALKQDAPLVNLLSNVINKGGRIFVFSEFLQPDVRRMLGGNTGVLYDNAVFLADRLKPYAMLVHQGESWAVFELRLTEEQLKQSLL